MLFVICRNSHTTTHRIGTFVGFEPETFTYNIPLDIFR